MSDRFHQSPRSRTKRYPQRGDVNLGFRITSCYPEGEFPGEEVMAYISGVSARWSFDGLAKPHHVV